MHRRYSKKNIPIELLRALVATVDSGSYAKAADSLDLTQSAIAAQIRRLGQILGGRVFEEGTNYKLTHRGMVVLDDARRLLAINDQILSLAGPKPAPRQLLIGFPPWWSYRRLVEIFPRLLVGPAGEKVSFRCDAVSSLIRDLTAGSLDLAYLCNVPTPPARPVVQWSEPLYWVKSPKLVLRPEAPIPLVGWTGTFPDQIALKLLQDHDMRYVVAFSGPDPTARRAAVAAGIGVLLSLERTITAEMEVAREEHLPQPPSIKSGIFAREGLDLQRLAPFIRQVIEALEPQPILASSPAVVSNAKATRSNRGAKATHPPQKVS